MMDVLRQADPAVWQAIHDERLRQQDGLEMIASENYTSPAVMAAQGSVLTNKYAEGLAGATTAAASLSTSSSASPLSESASCSERRGPTCSRTRVPRPTWRSTSP